MPATGCSFNGSSVPGLTTTSLPKPPQVRRPCPLSLHSFTAGVETDGTRLLEWAATSDGTLDKFEVERRGDYSEWTQVGTVGTGSPTGSRTRFRYHDQHFGEATYYYRLRMVEVDGTASYSPVVSSVLPAGASGTEVFPNPGSGYFTVSAAKILGGQRPVLYDSRGRRIDAVSVPNATGWVLDLVGQPAGIYFVRLGKETVRIIKR